MTKRDRTFFVNSDSDVFVSSNTKADGPLATQFRTAHGHQADVHQAKENGRVIHRLLKYSERGAKRFQFERSSMHDWLEYSQLTDNAFCFQCSHFPVPETSKAWTVVGYHDRNHAKSKMKSHSQSRPIRIRICSCFHGNSLKSGSIAKRLDTLTEEQLQANRLILGEAKTCTVVLEGEVNDLGRA